MKNKNTFTSVLGIGILTVGMLMFIHFSNDHIECENSIEYSTGENGEEIMTEKHICKEKFSI